MTLILGIAALVAKIAVTSSVIKREAPLAVGAVVLFGFVAWAGLTTATGIVLTVAAAGALLLLLRWAR